MQLRPDLHLFVFNGTSENFNFGRPRQHDRRDPPAELGLLGELRNNIQGPCPDSALDEPVTGGRG